MMMLHCIDRRIWLSLLITVAIAALCNGCLPRMQRRNSGFSLINWMTTLPLNLTTQPLLNLIIPGSHDSFTETLNPQSAIANDEPPWLHDIDHLPFVQQIVYRWSVTQKLSATHQLFRGSENTTVFIVHGLYGSSVYPILAQINTFLSLYSKEVVFLDFNHFYGMSQQAHHALIQTIRHTFGTKLCPAMRPRDVTLQQMWQSRHQVILFYDDSSLVAQNSDVIWPQSAISSPWANTDSFETLLHYLTDAINHRPMGHDAQFFVTQGIETETAVDILEHLTGSLEHTLADPTTRRLVQWLHSAMVVQHLKPKMNIIFCDFVEKHQFARTVVQMNYL